MRRSAGPRGAHHPENAKCGRPLPPRLRPVLGRAPGAASRLDLQPREARAHGARRRLPARAAGFGRARWIGAMDASGWAFSLQNLLVARRLTSLPDGGVAWYALAALPLGYPLSLLETLVGRPSTLFGALVKHDA